MHDEGVPPGKNPYLFRDPQGNWHSRLVPIAAMVAAIAVAVGIPFKVIGYGYLPMDDALRHAGRAVSGKTWADVLVLRDGLTIDSHHGWDSFLGWIHSLTGMDSDGMVAFSVIFLFVLVTLPAIFLTRRPETWIIALLFTVLSCGQLSRSLLGRPFISHLAVLVVMLLKRDAFDGRETRWGWMATMTVFMGVSIWFRLTWFLYLFPIALLFAARQWRAGCRLLACLAVATGVTALASGHPYSYLDHLVQIVRCLDSVPLRRMLVSELQPGLGSYPALVLVAVFLIFRHLRGRPVMAAVDNPVFFLIMLSWLLDLSSARWWLDFGIPAVTVWVAQEVDDALDGWSVTAFFDLRRAAVAGFFCAVTFLTFTNDAGGRWTNPLLVEYVDLEDESIRDWLPEPGGIIYSSDMGIFYRNFFRYPEQPWRYILGFESSAMPPEDLKTLRHIQWNRGAWEAYQGWVERMRPADRMWLMMEIGAGAPGIKGLEWKRIASDTWSGRLPRHGASLGTPDSGGTAAPSPFPSSGAESQGP